MYFLLRKSLIVAQIILAQVRARIGLFHIREMCLVSSCHATMPLLGQVVLKNAMWPLHCTEVYTLDRAVFCSLGARPAAK